MLRRSLMVLSAMVATTAASAALAGQSAPKVAAATPEAAGEYLLILGSCHDCHTPNWVESKGKVSRDSIMTGRALGFRGSWGTSYSKNLRTIAARQSEDHWVKVMKTTDEGDGLPPMPWHNMALMAEDDMRAMYRYIKSLGSSTGERIPKSSKPGIAPAGAYINLAPVNPDSSGKP